MPLFRPSVLPGASAFLIVALLAPITFPCHATDDITTAIGQWRLTKPLDSSDITALDDNQAQRLVGKVFTISKEKIQFGGQKCLPPSLEEQWVEPGLYLREQAHADAENLHLPNPVVVVELGCTVAFIRDSNHLVIHWKGWFFDAVRTNSRR